MQQIGVDRLTAGSIFKFGYLAYLVIFLPLGLFCGIRSAAGLSGVTANGQPVYGVAGLITSLAIALFLPLVCATFLLVGSLLLRLFKDKAPSLRLRPARSEPLSDDS